MTDVKASLISIIVPAYNSGNSIRRCITSIEGQSVENVEIIVVNDGSTDDTLSVCEEMRRDDSRLKIVNTQNKGVAAARNKGLSSARGEFVAFVDADDYVARNIYGPMLENMLYNGADICLSNLFIDSDHDTSERIIFSEGKVIKDQPAITNLIIIPMLGSSTVGGRDMIPGYLFIALYRREVITKHNLRFDNSLKIGEDLLFNLQFLRNAQCCALVKHAGYFYQQSKTSATRGYRTRLWEKCEILHSRRKSFLTDNNISTLEAERRITCSLVEFALISVENEISSKATNSMADKLASIKEICLAPEVQRAARVIPTSKTSLLLFVPAFLLRYHFPGRMWMLIGYYILTDSLRKLKHKHF